MPPSTGHGRAGARRSRQLPLARRFRLRLPVLRSLGPIPFFSSYFLWPRWADSTRCCTQPARFKHPPPLSQPHLTLAGGRHCQQHAGMRQHQAAGRLHRHRPAPGAVGSAGQALGQAASSERPVPRCALSRRHGTQCGPWLPAFYAIAHWRHIEGATSSLKHGTALTLRPPTPAAPGPAGTLSSYCYVLMCIHLLQTRPVPVLPVLQQLPPTFRRTVGQWTCEFCDDVSGSCTAACGGATAWQE